MRELSEQVTLNVSQSAAWEVLADFGGVADWAPYMRKSFLIGERTHGIGTSRGMRHAWGFRFVEEVTEWNDGNGYAFDVLRAPFPMKNVQETWDCSPANHGSIVTTRVTYKMHLGPLGMLLDWLLVRFIVQREMRAGLRGLKHHLETRTE